MKIFKSHGFIRWVVICLLIFIPLATLHTIETKVMPLKDAYQSSSNDFQYKASDEEWRDYDFKKYGATKVTGTCWFKTDLPENRWRDPYLYLAFVPNAKVYLDNEQIYTFSSHFEYMEHPHLLKLPEDFSGKTLTIQIDFNRHVLYPGKIMIDSPLNFVIGLGIQSDYRLLLSIVSMLLSFAGVIIYIGRREKSYLYFLCLLYTLRNCVRAAWFLLGLLAPSPVFAYMQDVLLPIGAYFFLQFYESLFRTGLNRLHRFLLIVLVVMFSLELITALFFSSVFLNEMSFLLQNIVMPAIVVLILLLSLRTYRKRKDAESFWFLAGFVTFGFFTLLYFLIPTFYGWKIVFSRHGHRLPHFTE